MNRSPRSIAFVAALSALVAAPLALAQDTAAQDSTTQGTAQTGAPAQASSGASWNDVDVDADGSISLAESAAVPALSQVYTQADANGDGALTPAEYQGFVAQAQAAAAAGSTAADASGYQPADAGQAQDDGQAVDSAEGVDDTDGE